jgi:hypothetical protein
MKYALAALALLLTAAPVLAQTVPEPRRSVLTDDPVNAVAGGSEWLMTYPASAPAPLPGTPFIVSLKLTLTPTSGTGTRIVTIPRASIVRETLAARCPGGLPPCLRADNVALPVGSFTVRASFVSGENVEGPLSVAVPFSASFPAPSVPPGTRILP